MALSTADRVRETSTTTGTGTFTLAGAVTGFRTFSAGIGTGNLTYYVISNRDVQSEWEVGYGTVTVSGSTTLSRTTIINSSNSGSAVSFSAGTKDVFVSLPMVSQPLIDPMLTQGRLNITNAYTDSGSNFSSGCWFVPYNGSRIALYNGNYWQLVTFSSTSVDFIANAVTISKSCTTNSTTTVTAAATAGLYYGMPITGTNIPNDTIIASITNSTTFVISKAATGSATNTMTIYHPNYDVFGFLSSGALALETLNWGANGSRTTNLTTQDGVFVKTGDATRKYLGSARLSGATTGVNSTASQRFLYSHYNQILQPLSVSDNTASWTYTTAAWRQSNANSANMVEIMNGMLQNSADIKAVGVSSSTAGSGRYTGIGINSTGTNSADVAGQAAGTGIVIPTLASLAYRPAAGYQYFAWLEYATASGTVTWTGNNSIIQTGISGVWLC